MDSFSILCDEFSRLPTEKQDEEIWKLFILLRGSEEVIMKVKDFRNRTFAKGLEKLPEDSEYEGDFFKNQIIPSLIDDFKESLVNTQEKLMDKLSELTDGLSIKRRSDEREKRYRVRFHSKLMSELPPGSESEIGEFVRGVDDSDEESDGESDEDDTEEESSSTHSDCGFNRRRIFKPKANN
ncbi:hypothetical protein M5689_022585 [Euphorbia peplus]|nr:hypothetical protein M5689_022585 [Euphorbia peplus]